MSRTRVFCSYSHNDAAYFKELEVQLASLKRSDCIELWSDREIRPGEGWQTKVSDALEGADLILLLISPDFIASDYCFEVELKRAMELADSGEAITIPILVRACDWSSMPFAKLQMMPTDHHPLTPIASRAGVDRDEAWAHVATTIRALLGRHRPWGGEGAPGSALDAKEVLLHFLNRWSRWGFNPQRIRNWGGRQPGFEHLAGLTLEQITAELEDLVRAGKVKSFESKSGARLYKRAA